MSLTPAQLAEAALVVVDEHLEGIEYRSVVGTLKTFYAEGQQVWDDEEEGWVSVEVEFETQDVEDVQNEAERILSFLQDRADSYYETARV